MRVNGVASEIRVGEGWIVPDLGLTKVVVILRVNRVASETCVGEGWIVPDLRLTKVAAILRLNKVALKGGGLEGGWE